MTTNNYILCRWRDAISDPPMEGTVHIVVTAEGRVLDITAIPGVPREAVQAAVDEMPQVTGPSMLDAARVAFEGRE